MTAPSNANTSGLEVVAWRHVMTDETGHDMMIRYGRNAEHPYGAPGEDYSKEFGVRSEPLVTAASAQARIAELEADLSKVIAQRDSHWDEYLAERQSRMEHGAREAGYLDAIPKLTDRATAAEARNAEVSMLAHRWMEAHDRLKAGLDYDLPTPADLPNEKARADRLAKALEEMRDEIESQRDAITHPHGRRAHFIDSTDQIRVDQLTALLDSAALQQETQP